jgi:hypothetical protein
VTITAARRLTLTGPQWTMLCRVAGVTAPLGFGPLADRTDDAAFGPHAPLDDVAVVRELIDLGALASVDRVHPSVAANLAVLARPAAAVRAEVSVGTAGQRAVFAVRGSLGASLFALEGEGVELSMFASTRLGYELIRCVPDEAETPQSAIVDALWAGAAPVPGRVPLLALGGRTPDDGQPLALADAEAALARYLSAQTIGVLHCVAMGPAVPAPGGGGSAAPAGAVVWWLTNSGWVGLRPAPDGSGRRMVEVVPVQRQELGSWLAPYLARILEVADESAPA